MASFDNIVLIVFVILSAVFLQQDEAYFNFHEEDEADLRQIMTILSKPRKLDRYKPDVQGNTALKLLKVNGFSWKNCGSASDPLRVTSLSVSPDPIKIPGTINLQFSADVKTQIGSPLQAKLEVKKKIGFWIPIPCIDQVGSCTYADLCGMDPLQPGEPCPQPLAKYNIPCACPLKPGNYSMPRSAFQIPASLPSFLADGEYQVTAELSVNGHQVACYEITASLSA